MDRPNPVVQFIEMVREHAAALSASADLLASRQMYCDVCGRETPHSSYERGNQEIFVCLTPGCGRQSVYTTR